MKIGSKTIAVINTLANVYASHREYSGFFSKIRTAEWSNIFISPAVLLIATILKNAGHSVRIYNDLQNEIDPDRMNEEIILISSITPSSRRAYEIARLFPGRKIIMGGVHVSALPHEAVEYADHVVVGECESKLLDLVEGRIKDKIVYGERVQNLDALPFLDFSLLKNLPDILPVQTSRGCNYRCNYCTIASMYGTYRSRSPENIINELLNFRERYGEIQKIDFRIDADFTFLRRRAMEVLNSMKAEGIRPKVIAANSRLQVYKDRELLQCLSGHNITLCIGIESLNQDVLDGYQKEQKETEILEAIKTLHDYDIKVMGYFIFGADQDDKDTLKHYSEFIDKSKIDFFQVSLLTPYPGTEFYNNLLLQKRLFTTDWTYYDGLHITFRPARMTAYELQKKFMDFYQKEFSLKFLLNPRWLFNPEILRNKLLIYTLRKMFKRDMINYYSFLETNSNKTINPKF
jgi:radical SAM superfamily enzyme YgiQ (UPF0313 family)